jgi:hypothetical protein
MSLSLQLMQLIATYDEDAPYPPGLDGIPGWQHNYRFLLNVEQGKPIEGTVDVQPADRLMACLLTTEAMRFLLFTRPDLFSDTPPLNLSAEQ